MHNAIRTLTSANTYIQPLLVRRNTLGYRCLWFRRSFHTPPSQRDNYQVNQESNNNTSESELSDSVKSEDTVPTIDWSKFERALDQGQSLLNDADKHWPGITTVSGSSIPPTLRESWRQNTESKTGLETRRSWRNRVTRHSREDEISFLPKWTRWTPLPQWFLDRCVDLYVDEKNSSDLLSLDSDDIPLLDAEGTINAARAIHTLDVSKNEKPEPTVEQNTNSPDADADGTKASTKPAVALYQIKRELFLEIQALARAGLCSATSMKQEDASVSRPHLLLQSPKAGGNFFLLNVVKKVVKSLEADCIRLDPGEISELIVDSGVDLPENLSDPLKLLGYDAYHLDEDLEVEEEGEYDADDSRDGSADFKPFQGVIDSIFRRGNTSSSNSSRKTPAYKVNVVVPKLLAPNGGSDIFSSSWSMPMATGKGVIRNNGADTDVQYRMLMDRVLDSASIKSSLGKSVNRSTNETRRPLVIVIEEYLELRTSKAGNIVLDMLHELVQERRTARQEILIIGLSSSEDLFPATSFEDWKKMESVPGQGPYQTVITVPSFDGYHHTFEQDQRLRTRLLNLRNLQDMLRRLAWSKEILGEWCWSQEFLDNQTMVALRSGSLDSPMDLTVWSAHRVNKIATVALGLVSKERPQVEYELAEEAMQMIVSSSKEKFNFYTAHEKLHEQKEVDTATDSKADSQLELSKIRKSANSHEKRLLHGVIDKKDISTKFSSVHAPESTIKSLKTLTSLSLHRPDAFSYGVLANDKIPGLLLYGPPGTGKTLLAKAVAGESGATVLEVSGSDIYDMYVGEGEKNVRAIFTLAEKLSPCVVFIDEADAILGSRSTPANRTTHRELINQFLREWDGLSSKNTSAFIMVATNRPFDLDDAVLRRLPRRLLVDLPTEKDREAILKIHLANEKLDESVSIESLAQHTPFYSGSDLKNVCVSAALQAVQEEYDAKTAFENEQAGKETPETYTYPQVRTLTQAHFDKALADVSASISEDMSSLTAIRKFDEKYGDRRGRKPKGGLGFGMRSNADAERERREDGRIRRDVLVNT